MTKEIKELIPSELIEFAQGNKFAIEFLHEYAIKTIGAGLVNSEDWLAICNDKPFTTASGVKSYLRKSLNNGVYDQWLKAVEWMVKNKYEKKLLKAIYSKSECWGEKWIDRIEYYPSKGEDVSVIRTLETFGSNKDIYEFLKKDAARAWSESGSSNVFSRRNWGIFRVRDFMKTEAGREAFKKNCDNWIKPALLEVSNKSSKLIGVSASLGDMFDCLRSNQFKATQHYDCGGKLILKLMLDIIKESDAFVGFIKNNNTFPPEILKWFAMFEGNQDQINDMFMEIKDINRIIFNKNEDETLALVLDFFDSSLSQTKIEVTNSDMSAWVERKTLISRMGDPKNSEVKPNRMSI